MTNLAQSIMVMDLRNVRESYKFDSLEENRLSSNPIEQFKLWYEDYTKLQPKDANAFTLSTIGLDGTPDSRIVLMKELKGQNIIFFTNYHSRKGQSIASNPNVHASFFWKEQERQVLIKGKATKISQEESTEYFHSRPVLSQLGAVASNQSEPIESRTALEEKFDLLKNEYAEKVVPKPEHWGGYAIEILEIEFWQGREGRLHDRIRFVRNQSLWTYVRLQP